MLDTLQLDVGKPVNRWHPLNGRLTHWWKNLPGFRGGEMVPDLMRQNNGTWSTMAIAPRWRDGNKPRPGGIWGSWEGDGINDRVSLTSVNIASTCTLAFWVKFDTAPNTVILGSSSPEYFPYIDNTNVYIRTNGQSGLSVAHGGINLDQWYHIAICQSPTDGYTLYVDGVSQGNASGTRTPPVDSLMAYNNDSFELNGELDDVRLWNGRWLTAGEIKQLYRLSQENYEPTLNWVTLPLTLPPVASGNDGAALYHHMQNLGVYA